MTTEETPPGECEPSGAENKTMENMIMTSYERLLNNFYCCLEAVEKVTKKEEPIPATTRLVAAELQDVLYLVEDIIKLSTVGEIEAQTVREFADTLCDEIRARIKSLMNPMGVN